MNESNASVSTHPSQPPPAWTKLGEYKIIGEIAEGTFGHVRLAVHVVTNQKVAMKFISKKLIQESGTKGRVKKETEYMRLLSRHPHIVKLYEVINTATDIVLVLEYAGGELFQLIVDHGRMDEPKARRYFQQMISGVAYSHRLGVAHRDLKPENVLLDAEDNVKITDFGLSNALADGEFLKTSCGSPNYAAPEIVNGKLYAGPEIDVWSSGVILYVMLCGRLPFEEPDPDNVKGLYRKINEGIFHVPSHLSHDARNLIFRMLAVDSIKRITIPEIIEHPFFATNLPRYLAPLPSAPGPVLGTLSSLVAPIKRDFEVVQGVGRIDEKIVDELAAMIQLPREVVWSAFRKDGANSMKVAYCLLRDKNRAGKGFAEFAEEERASQLSQLYAMEPSLLLPPVVSPLAMNISPQSEESNPFEDALDDYDEDDEETDSELDFNIHDNSFAVLRTSLPEHGYDSQRSAMGPQSHHLTSYASAISNLRSSPSSPGPKDPKKQKARWHFGIRSRSPPMEVMLEIYTTLQTLGMEWKQKKGMWGPHGLTDENVEMDYKEGMSIFHIETRYRIKDVVVLMDLQLYQVDSINYLVDFKNVGYYHASTDPNAGRFDRADESTQNSAPNSAPGSLHSNGISKGNGHIKPETPVVSPFLFLEVATKLIIELAGGPSS